MSRVFISYARESERRAEQVVDRLRALGHDVWRDNELPAHRPYAEVIEERLREADAVVVLWSQAAARSHWVRGEADVGRNAGRLVQASLDGSLPPLPFNQIQCADLRDWDGRTETAGWRKLAEGVAALAPRDPSTATVGTTPPAEAPPPARRPRWPWIAAGAAALVALVLGGIALSPRLFAPKPAALRVAVLPFRALGGGANTTAFAASLADEILSVLSANRASAVQGAPDADTIRSLGAGLLLDGTVEEAGERMRVRVHLDDAPTRTVLWSEAFERPATEAEPLKAEVASKTTTLATYALAARAAGLSNPVLADYIAGVEHIRFDWTGGLQAAEPILRRVVDQAPRFAGGHVTLAAALGMQPGGPGNPRAAEQRLEATREAQTALTLAGGQEAYSLLAALRPPFDWQGREALFHKGLTLDTADASTPYLASGQLAATGRLEAAVETARRGVGLDPLWPGPSWSLGNRLLDVGRQTEGLALFDHMAELWPQHDATRLGRFWGTAMYGDPDAALALIADPRTQPPGFNPQAAALWRQFLAAVKSGDPAERARAAAAIEASEKGGGLPAGAATAMIARLGDVDRAFVAANDYVAQLASYDRTGPAYLFLPATAPLRRDPRFMPLVARVGLPQFWRASGLWPDFCAEPGLPYDCKAAAAKLAGTKG